MLFVKIHFLDSETVLGWITFEAELKRMQRRRILRQDCKWMSGLISFAMRYNDIRGPRWRGEVCEAEVVRPGRHVEIAIAPRNLYGCNFYANVLLVRD